MIAMELQRRHACLPFLLYKLSSCLSLLLQSPLICALTVTRVSLPFLLFLLSFASFCRAVIVVIGISEYCLDQKLFFNFSFILLPPLCIFHLPTLTHIVLSFLPPFLLSISSPVPPIIYSPLLSSPPLSPRQILFKKLSCSLMVKTLANRYLHTWQNAGGQGTGWERQGWRERGQVREKGKKNNKLTTRRPLFPQAEMDGSEWMSVCFFSAPSCFIRPLFQSI